jgi:hypothetical protein
MTASDAEFIANRVRSAHHVPPDSAVGDVSQRFIELPQSPRDQPLLLADILVWVVRFVKDATWVELAIADDTGGVVRARRSQGRS